jgi:hypothetical protein
MHRPSREEANRLAAARCRDEQVYLDRRQAENRELWVDWHLRMAEAVITTARESAARHIAAARALEQGEELR